MTTVTGVVKKVWENQVNTKRGASTAYSVQLTSGDRISAGFQVPPCKEGDSITAEVEGQYNNLVKGTLAVVDSAQPSPTPAEASSPPSAGRSQGSPSPRAGGTQLAIQYQASRNSALHAVEIAVSAGAVSLPQKKGAQLDALLSLIDEVTLRYQAATDDVVEHGGIDHLTDIGDGIDSDGIDF